METRDFRHLCLFTMAGVMMSILRNVVLLMLFTVPAFSQSPSIRSLFASDSYLPHVLLPFQVSHSLISAGGKISSVKVESATGGADCRAMVDPYRTDIFLLKCKSPSTVSVRVYLSNGDTVYHFAYTGVAITTPSGLEIVDPDPTPQDPTWVAGRALYNSYCLTCHSPTSKQGRSASQIRSAILGVGAMSSRSELTSLTTDQLNKIATYMANP